MDEYLQQVSAAARNAAFRKNWPAVDALAAEILGQDRDSAEGHFLKGLAAKFSNASPLAEYSLARALEIDDRRHDAAIELADLYCVDNQHAEAAKLVGEYAGRLENSPRYLHMAGTVYSRVGMADKAWPLLCRADSLQPDIFQFQMSLGTCAVYLGKLDEATRIFQRLLDKAPTHQRNHYQLSRLNRATDDSHIRQMESLLAAGDQPPSRNVFLYYAIGKEMEDLERWQEAFAYYKKGGDAVTSVADYDIESDLALIDTVIRVCDDSWLNRGGPSVQSSDKTPVFLVGLPRSGTTLTERIVSSHSQVLSVDETQFMQMTIRRESGLQSDEKMTPEMIEAAALLDIDDISRGYMNMLRYRLGTERMFIDKMPFNIYYLGFIAKAFPDAKIIHMRRNPMDSCFAMYKQVFASAYKFSYSLANLGRFYIAYDRLVEHWKNALQDRFVEVHYERLVSDQEGQTRRLLASLELPFESACLDFDRNESGITTASSVQVREKIHARSVDRWKRYATELQPLKAQLEEAGIKLN